MNITSRTQARLLVCCQVMKGTIIRMMRFRLFWLFCFKPLLLDPRTLAYRCKTNGGRAVCIQTLSSFHSRRNPNPLIKSRHLDTHELPWLFSVRILQQIFRGVNRMMVPPCGEAVPGAQECAKQAISQSRHAVNPEHCCFSTSSQRSLINNVTIAHAISLALLLHTVLVSRYLF